VSSGSHFSHGMSNDEFFHISAPDCCDTMGIIGQSNSAGLVKASRRCSDVLTGVDDQCPTCLTPRATNQVYDRSSFKLINFRSLIYLPFGILSVFMLFLE
jgi:hypothetical protein